MKRYGWPATPATRLALADVKRYLIDDSIERRRLVDRLVQLVREDERERVLGIRARAQGGRQ